MRQMMKIGVLMPAAVLLVSGCATKDWVREQFTKSDAIVDQRFVKVEGQVEGVSTEVKGVTTQVKSLEGAVAEAKGRADAAMTKAEGVDTRLSRLWSNRYNQKTADTLEVYFGFDKAELTDGAQTASGRAWSRSCRAIPTLDRWSWAATPIPRAPWTTTTGSASAGSRRCVASWSRRASQLSRVQRGRPRAHHGQGDPGREEAPGHRQDAGGPGLAARFPPSPLRGEGRVRGARLQGCEGGRTHVPPPLLFLPASPPGSGDRTGRGVAGGGPVRNP